MSYTNQNPKDKICIGSTCKEKQIRLNGDESDMEINFANWTDRCYNCYHKYKKIKK